MMAMPAILALGKPRQEGWGAQGYLLWRKFGRMAEGLRESVARTEEAAVVSALCPLTVVFNWNSDSDLKHPAVTVGTRCCGLALQEEWCGVDAASWVTIGSPVQMDWCAWNLNRFALFSPQNVETVCRKAACFKERSIGSHVPGRLCCSFKSERPWLARLGVAGGS